VTLNDITPQTEKEIVFCSVVLIFGSFLVSFVLGGITAELQKAQEREKEIQNKLEYVDFSLDAHRFPEDLKSKFK